jgi:hypothetical protein
MSEIGRVINYYCSQPGLCQIIHPSGQGSIRLLGVLATVCGASELLLCVLMLTVAVIRVCVGLS